MKLIFQLLALILLNDLLPCDAIPLGKCTDTELISGNSRTNVTEHAGLLVTNATRGHCLFYWLFESQRDPANDPIVLW